MRALKISAGIALCIVSLYFLGPTMAKPVFNKKLPLMTDRVERYVDSIEAGKIIRPGNEAKIIWANDTLKTQTYFVLLYLHGFSASWYEGFPVNVDRKSVV